MEEPVYLRRPNIFPKKSSEFFFFLLIGFMIPATYWLEIWIVFPSVFQNYPVLYWAFFIIGHFVLHNVVGNYLGILMHDTSIRGRKMPGENEPGVQYCNTCATYTPPRSFHCPSCDVCILKRDHHCIFTGCCVGFYNHRFFVCFVFYLSLTTIGTLPFNIYFLWDMIEISNISYLIMFICPFLAFFSDSSIEKLDVEHIYVIISLVDIYGAFFTLIWLHYHLKLILKGTVVYEMKKCINIYNLGTKKNLELVFGKKWYLTLISPFIKSPLISDGIRFPVIKND